MIKAGIKPNQSTFTLWAGYGLNSKHEDALNSCCGLEALDRGKQIHTKTIKRGLDLDVFLGNSLVVMYSKCGNINDGMAVFYKISNRNLVSWNSLIVACAQHDYGVRALEFFDQMTHAQVHPDEITFVGLLTACSHCRMLEKGRSGNLEEAQEFIQNMPVKANSMVWLALLSACRVHSNVELAERAARRIFGIEPHSSAAYILSYNFYASCERWNDVSQIRKIIKDRGIVKMPGCSWITVKRLKHEFPSGDRSHPMSKEIYAKLDSLTGKLKDFGYVSDKSFALHDVEDEQKEVMLSRHSERLAIAFGLLCTVEGSTITVMKNLRVCGDCQRAIKLITKVVGREIIVGDSSRFHHFKNGACSCGDYW
ncbi:hypothetical protein AAC387_Pa12g2241 [Persea americana]